MYRSIYHLTSKDKGVLPIHAGDIFEFIEQHDENWWRMRARDSSVGLVPACYLEPVDNETVREIVRVYLRSRMNLKGAY